MVSITLWVTQPAIPPSLLSPHPHSLTHVFLCAYIYTYTHITSRHITTHTDPRQHIPNEWQARESCRLLPPERETQPQRCRAAVIPCGHPPRGEVASSGGGEVRVPAGAARAANAPELQ